MTSNQHQDYLSLLRQVGSSLDRLTELAQQKTEAVNHNDLIALDEVLKQEQAMTLVLRGHEQKRLKLLSQMGLERIPLSDLEAHYPASLRAEAKQTAESLRKSYRVFQTAWEHSRHTLEHQLHEVEQIISSLGGDPTGGLGYSNPNVEPPKKMKTDFRA